MLVSVPFNFGMIVRPELVEGRYASQANMLKPYRNGTNDGLHCVPLSPLPRKPA